MQVASSKTDVSTEREPCDKKWFLDSACSNSMTGQKSDLANFKKFKDDKPHFVELADKSLVRAVGFGDLNVYLPDESGKSVPVVFKEVMFVPQLEKRLISIGQVTKRGAQVLFNSDSVTMRIGGRNFSFGCSFGNLYNMNCSVVASCNFVQVHEPSEGSFTAVGELDSEINFGSGSSCFKGVKDDVKPRNGKSCPVPIETDVLNPDDIVNDESNIGCDGGVEVGILESGIPTFAGDVAVGEDSIVGSVEVGDVSSWSNSSEIDEMLLPLWTAKIPNVVDVTVPLNFHCVDVSNAACVAEVSGARGVRSTRFLARNQHLLACGALPSVIDDNGQLLSSGSVRNYAANCQFPQLSTDYNERNSAPSYLHNPDFPDLYVAHGPDTRSRPLR